MSQAIDGRLATWPRPVDRYLGRSVGRVVAAHDGESLAAYAPHVTYDEALALARTEVPWWVPIWPLAVALGVGAFSWLATRLVARFAIARFRRDAGDAHWTMRARAGVSARGLVMITWGAVAMIGATLATSGSLGMLPRGWGPLFGAVAAVVGSSHAARPLYAALGLPKAARAGGLRTLLAALFLMFPGILAAALVSRVIAICELDVDVALLVWAAGGVFVAIWVRGLAFVIARAVGVIAPAPPRLRSAVATASQAVGVAAPETFVWTASMTNAFAFPFARRLAFTSGIVDLLDDAELESVALHEIGHLIEPPSALFVRGLRLTGAYALGLYGVVDMVAPGASVLLVLVFLATQVVGRRHALTLESEADATARAHAEEGAYARALERMHEAMLLPVVVGGPKTHPDLYDRMLAAGVTPSYPRPTAPPRPRAMMLAILVSAAASAFGVRMALARWGTPEVQLASGAPRAIALVARSFRDADQPERAIPFDVLRAHEMGATHVCTLKLLSIDYADAGQCDAARDTLALLTTRLATGRVVDADEADVGLIEEWIASCDEWGAAD